MLGSAGKEEIAAIVTRCADGFQSALAEPGATEAFAAKVARHADLVVRRDVGGELVGCVAFYCNDRATRAAFVTLVAVDPAWRGNGLARAMLHDCIVMVREQGFLTVRLRVLQRNRGAIALYQSLGFGVSDRGDDDLGMVLSLPV